MKTGYRTQAEMFGLCRCHLFAADYFSQNPDVSPADSTAAGLQYQIIGDTSGEIVPLDDIIAGIKYNLDDADDTSSEAADKGAGSVVNTGVMAASCVGSALLGSLICFLLVRRKKGDNLSA